MTYQGEILGLVESERLVDIPPRVDVGSKWPLDGHREYVFLVSNKCTTNLAAEDRALQEKISWEINMAVHGNYSTFTS